MSSFVKGFFTLVVLPLLIPLSGCHSDGVPSGASAPSAFNLHSIAPSSGKTLFSWEESEGASEYQLCLKDDTKLNSCEVLATTSSLSAEVSGLGALKGLTSSYFVVAKNASGSQRSNDKPLSPTEVSQLIQYLKASNAEGGDYFGSAVSLSSDGHTLAVGVTSEDSNGLGVNSGAEADNSASNSGAVYLFRFTGGAWTQEAYLKASNAEDWDVFGWAVSLSSDGNTLAVGASSEDSNGLGVNSGAEADNSATDSGAVYLFRFTGGSWTQEAYLKASNAEGGDHFGNFVSLSSDDHTLAVGAASEDSNGLGVNSGVEIDNSATDSGAVYLY